MSRTVDPTPSPASTEPISQPGLDTEGQVYEAYRRYGAELYRFVLRGVGDPGAAEDVIQETFLKAWRFAPRYNPELSSLRVWLFGIARNAMRDQVRSTKARPWQSDIVDPHGPRALTGPVEDFTEQLLTSWVVEEALRRLSEQHRVALVETQLMGRSYAEVCADLDIPIGTLRSRVFYALKALRVAMDDMGVVL